MVLDEYIIISKPTTDACKQFIINNEKLICDVLLSFGFLNSLLKSTTDIWLRNYFKQLLFINLSNYMFHIFF